MAQQDPISTGNGSNGSNGSGDEPQVATLAQYIKDLSVESPSAPQVFQWQDQPSLDVNFNLNVERVSEDVNEVMLKVEVRAHSANGVHFLVDLSFAGLFGLRNFPEEAVGPFLLIEAPRLLFPFARQIIADAVQQTGFPPLLLEPIDFNAVFLQQMQAQQAELGSGGDGGEAPAAETPPAGDDDKA